MLNLRLATNKGHGSGGFMVRTSNWSATVKVVDDGGFCTKFTILPISQSRQLLSWECVPSGVASDRLRDGVDLSAAGRRNQTREPISIEKGGEWRAMLWLTPRSVSQKISWSIFCFSAKRFFPIFVLWRKERFFFDRVTWGSWWVPWEDRALMTQGHLRYCMMCSECACLFRVTTSFFF